jgi:hypothetical protein
MRAEVKPKSQKPPAKSLPKFGKREKPIDVQIVDQTDFTNMDGLDERDIAIPTNQKFKYRPSSSYYQDKSETEIQSRIENASFNYNQDLKMLRSQNKFFTKRPSNTAVPGKRAKSGMA